MRISSAGIREGVAARVRRQMIEFLLAGALIVWALVTGVRAQDDAEPTPIPAVDKSVADEPAIEVPVAAEPESDKPAEPEPATDKPAAEKPTAEETTVEEKPAAEEPAKEKPAADKPAAEDPPADKPVADKPAAEEPAADATEANKPVASGLSGLLPEEAPADILATLGTLPETWTAWGEGITQKLSDFYSAPPADLAAQRAMIAFLKLKLATVNRALADHQFGSIRNQLISLHGSLARRIDVLEAVLDTATENPLAAVNPAIDQAKQDLLAATDVADGYLDVVEGGAAWKTYLRTAEVRAIASGGDLAQILAQISPVLAKLDDASQTSDTAVRAFANAPALRTYHRDLGRAVSVLTKVAGTNNKDAVRNQLQALLAGLEKYEASSTTEAAVQVRSAYDALRNLTADGGARLTIALRQHYFNSNIQIAISEGFFNRTLAKSQSEDGGVRDFVLGADVYGSQTTTTFSSFDLIPSERNAVIRINLTGNVDTNTEAYKSSVVIYSNGNSQFFGSKDIFFDGMTFSTNRAAIQVNSSNTPVGASTKLDHMPLLGNFARNLAMDGARKKQPQAEAIAAERVGTRVGPEFDNAVDSQFSELNSKLNEKVVTPLKSDNLYPDFKASRTTDTELQLFSRLMAGDELAGDANLTASLAEGEVALRVHESLINNALDRLQLAGKMMTDEELHLFLQGKLTKLRKKPVTLAEPKPATGPEADQYPQAFVFADTDPLRVKIADGKIMMIIRAGFHREEAKGGDIPPQIVTVPLTLTVEGEEIVATRGDVSVDPVDPVTNVTAQVARAGVIKGKIQSAFQESRHSRKLTLEKDSPTPISISVTEVTALDGWLSYRFR